MNTISTFVHPPTYYHWKEGTGTYFSILKKLENETNSIRRELLESELAECAAFNRRLDHHTGIANEPKRIARLYNTDRTEGQKMVHHKPGTVCFPCTEIGPVQQVSVRV